MAIESKFSTELLPVEQRFDVWRESIAVLYDVEMDRQATTDDFHASVHGLLFDDLMIARCRTSAQTYNRRSLHIAQDGVDHYMIQLFMEGSQKVRRGSKDVECNPGDILVHDLASEHRAESLAFDNLSVIVPRRVLEPMLKNTDSQHGRVLSAGDPLVRMLSRHMRDLYELSGSMDDAQRNSLSTVTSSLIAASLNGTKEQAEGHESSLATVALLQAKRIIDDLLNKPELDAATIAQAAGVSRAALYRMFEPYDGVMTYVRRRRLSGCLRDLTDRDQNYRSIAEIAFHWGFSSEAHFSRAFRKQFGMSPSDARHRDQIIPVEVLRALKDERIGDRDYETWITDTLHY